MAEGEIVITFNTLYDLLRREKANPDLQELDENFLRDVVEYINGKKALLEGDGLYADEEKIKLSHQLQQVYRILKELYDKREGKIIEITRNLSRTKGHIHKDNLLPQEDKLFDEMLALFNKYRGGIIKNVLQGKMPGAEESEPKPLKTASQLEQLKVKFTKSMPEFIGPDMEKYGPFEAGEIRELPEDIAQFVVKRGEGELT